MITGKELIDAGVKPGKWFPAALAEANGLMASGAEYEVALAAALAQAPLPAVHLPLSQAGSRPLHLNIEANGDVERANVEAVQATMQLLLRTPVVMAGAVMPDACPAGPPGTIPVGGVAVSQGIHPGMHSSDVCCSMALSNVGRVDPLRLLDAVAAVTHFGPTRRPVAIALPSSIGQAIAGNGFLRSLLHAAEADFATQGDGNHFAFVGTLRSTGDTILVTHHGSRSLGARLYKAGMATAETSRKQVSPETLPANAWIAADTAEGDAYWDALQIVRDWTKASHFAIHDLAIGKIAGRVTDRYWNEHNFVFRRSDGLFYHAKGATPAFDGWSADATELTLIPLNMGQPILVARGLNAPHGLGFSPHGAGRNISRTRHKRLLVDREEKDVFAAETRGIDARFFCGEIDVSELPSAYKDAASVRRQIETFGLADIVDEVMPYGCVMAGDWERNAPWRRKQASAGERGTIHPGSS